MLKEEKEIQVKAKDNSIKFRTTTGEMDSKMTDQERKKKIRLKIKKKILLKINGNN